MITRLKFFEGRKQGGRLIWYATEPGVELQRKLSVDGARPP